MWKPRLLLASSAIFVVLVLVFFVRYAVPNHQSLAAAILSLTGIQSATSSSEINTGTTTPTLIDVLQQLQDQNQLLTSEVADLRTKAKEASLKVVFTRTLKHGDSGDEVKALQTFLSGVLGAATTSTTGFYGSVTEKAVKDFQMQAGLKGTGVFDAQTRDMLAVSIQNQTATDTASADFIPMDLSSVANPQQNIQDLQNQVSQLSSGLSDTQTTIADLQSQITNLESELSDLQGSIAAQASLPPPPPATSAVQPLAISNIQVGSLTKTSATVTWTTNNPSTSEVDYSSSASMPISQTLIAKSSTMTTSHSTALPSLISGTTYYYHIISVDSSNTIANSSNLTFTTLR